MALHDELVVFDGLIAANFARDIFEDMRRGGVSAANLTYSVWEVSLLNNHPGI